MLFGALRLMPPLQVMRNNGQDSNGSAGRMTYYSSLDCRQQNLQKLGGNIVITAKLSLTFPCARLYVTRSNHIERISQQAGGLTRRAVAVSLKLASLRNIDFVVCKWGELI